jgi:hypothetical protein
MHFEKFSFNNCGLVLIIDFYATGKMSEVFFFVALGSHGTRRELFSASYYLSGGFSMRGYG